MDRWKTDWCGKLDKPLNEVHITECGMFNCVGCPYIRRLGEPDLNQEEE